MIYPEVISSLLIKQEQFNAILKKEKSPEVSRMITRAIAWVNECLKSIPEKAAIEKINYQPEEFSVEIEKQIDWAEHFKLTLPSNVKLNWNFNQVLVSLVDAKHASEIKVEVKADTKPPKDQKANKSFFNRKKSK